MKVTNIKPNSQYTKEERDEEKEKKKNRETYK